MCRDPSPGGYLTEGMCNPGPNVNVTVVHFSGDVVFCSELALNTQGLNLHRIPSMALRFSKGKQK